MSGYINKIFIDSRFKTSSSNSNTDFTIELNENIQLSDRTGCVITDIIIPRCWYGINNTNNRLYFRAIVNGANRDLFIIIKPQNYTLFNLATAITNAMNQAMNGDPDFICTADTNTGSITITITDIARDIISGFYIFTDEDLMTRVNGTWTGRYYNASNLLSVNNVLKNNINNMFQYNINNPYISGVVDLISIHSLYLTSSNLSTYNNIGPRGERNILKKIICNVGFGELLTEYNWMAEDYTDVSNRALKLIDFKLVDTYGNVLDLNGAHISFSLLFINF